MIWNEVNFIILKFINFKQNYSQAQEAMNATKGRERKSDIRSLEERINEDTTLEVIYEGMVISDKDKNFPGVPPDLWKDWNSTKVEGKKEGEYYHIKNDDVCRDEYRKRMKNKSTWKRPNKHYV